MEKPVNQQVTKGDLERLKQVAQELLAAMDARSQDILTRRYGMETGKIETLDSIGKEYGITRERVRQIEAQAKKVLALRKDILEEIDAMLQSVFSQYGGLIGEDHLAEVIERDMDGVGEGNFVIFYLDLLPGYENVRRSPHFEAFWRHIDLHNEYAEQVVKTAEDILSKAGHPLKQDQLLATIRRELDVSEEILPNDCIYALLRASKNLKITVFDEWGLAEWVETSPRGVGDKAYIVMRRSGKPSHFREITNMINDVQFDHKEAHEQTVHNELIKDNRFVLVGRGLYALKEWGYVSGTVADVLESILEQEGRPMSREELLDAVLKQRMVKKTTVLLGLQNSQKFKREGERYTLNK